uniref:F-box domain-containing protein n=1 Tax=Rhabditophanes sp. KR3021 TaxID=114890 RepID=A0AC35UDZ5_9BILA
MHDYIRTVFSQPDLFDQIFENDINFDKLKEIGRELYQKLDCTSVNRILVPDPLFLDMMIAGEDEEVVGAFCSFDCNTEEDFAEIIEVSQEVDSLIKATRLKVELMFIDKTTFSGNKMLSISSTIKSIFEKFVCADTLHMHISTAHFEIEDNIGIEDGNQRHPNISEDEDVYNAYHIYQHLRSPFIKRISILNWHELMLLIRNEEIANENLFQYLPNLNYLKLDNLYPHDVKETSLVEVDQLVDLFQVNEGTTMCIKLENSVVANSPVMVRLLTKLDQKKLKLKLYLDDNVLLSLDCSTKITNILDNLIFYYSCVNQNERPNYFLDKLGSTGINKLRIHIDNKAYHLMVSEGNKSMKFFETKKDLSLIMDVSECQKHALKHDWNQLCKVIPDGLESLRVNFSLQLSGYFYDKVLGAKFGSLKILFFEGLSALSNVPNLKFLTQLTNLQFLYHNCMGQISLAYPSNLRVLSVNCSNLQNYTTGKYSNEFILSQEMECNCFKTKKHFKHFLHLQLPLHKIKIINCYYNKIDDSSFARACFNKFDYFEDLNECL